VSDSFFDENSRLDKFNKRRKNTKLINVMIVLGVLLGIFLLFQMFTKDDDQPVDQTQTSNEEETNNDGQEADIENGESDNLDNQDAQEGENTDDNDTTDEPESAQNDEEGSNDETTDIGQAEDTSDDPNVSETIVKEWEPIGTVQKEPHVATYDDKTVDWKEMWEAARYATGLTEDDYIEWRAENNGSHNKSKLTISNKAQTETYRVYIEWIENEGWKPIKVEVLKENDIKKMYEENQNEENSGTEQQESGE
jgi:hypothetical protein